MSSAAFTSTTRTALGVLVEKEARRVGSRTVAYEYVAQRVGTSGSWIRKFLRESDEVKEPRITLFLNIRAAYDQLCERVESDNRADEHKLRILRGDLNAVDAGLDTQGNSKNSNVMGKD